MPHKRHARPKVETLPESFILLDSIIQIGNDTKQRKGTSGYSENCVDKIIELYHSSLFTGHQGVIKTYLTISDKFFISHLIHYLRLYLSAWHICQLFRNDKPPSQTVGN